MKRFNKVFETMFAIMRGAMIAFWAIIGISEFAYSECYSGAGTLISVLATVAFVCWTVRYVVNDVHRIIKG